MKFEPGGPARYAHQNLGLRRMIERGGVMALLFDPGLGKTATVIDYASIMAIKSPTEEVRVLVVCPLVAVDTWVIQMNKFAGPQVHWWAEALGGSLLERAEALAARGGNLYRNRLVTGKPQTFKAGTHPKALHHEKAMAWQTSDPELRAQDGPDAVPGPRIVMEVINLDTLVSRAVKGRKTMADIMVEAIRRYGPDLLVFDESHKIKSASGNASRLAARLTKFVKRRVLLTGTVMPHSPLDVFGQWRFLDPYAFGTKDRDGNVRQTTFGSFKEKFAVTGGWMGKEIVGYRNLDEMQEVMARNAVVARKAEALDLPPTQDVTIPVHLSAREKKAYTEMKSNLAAQLTANSQASTSSMLTQMMRLRQITSGHLPDDEGKTHAVGRSKVATAASLIHDTLAGEKRIVVFALFVHEIDMLAQALAKAGTDIMVIAGGTKGEDRMAMRKRFGSEDPQRIVMIAQIKTMSLAVNELVTASNAVFASLSQQRDDYVQGRDRLDRIGQTKPVTFWHLIAPGTVDEVILQSHRDRTNLESAMLKHVKDLSE